MRQLLVIGIGAGDPEHLTLQAVRAMNEVDAFFHMHKGEQKDQLAQLRRDLCDAHITGSYTWIDVPDPERDRTGPGYEDAVADWHEARAGLYEGLLLDLPEDGVAGILVWGDPALYDSTLRVLDKIVARGKVEFTHRVIPGITAPQVLAAQHAITWNRIGGAVQVTTGRRLAAEGLVADDTIVMLDAHSSFTTVPEDTEIYWGAYLGTPDEILLSGTVGSVGAEISRVRAAAREDKGWIMDTYLLRRP
ncbi:MAG: precorrin-6A synthase (deacetylating) [Frankiales bacterium]|nr:precorrin-6A synthase (deacetylating) [Frankiales bacterium]